MIYLFGKFELDTARCELLREGAACAVEPRVFDLLLYLVENRDRMISKEELNKRIWEGRFVSDASLSRCIKLARQAIGDNGRLQEWIRTVPRRGFRFIGSVEVRNLSHISDRSASTRTEELIALDNVVSDRPTIAVLPFDNMSGDPEQEFFADGIAEEIITSLSRFRSLFVIARNSSFSFKGSSIDVRRIARDLGVRYVVEGSVRKSGSRVRISAQLIDATSGSHLWADRFEGSLDDVFDLQDEITEKIVVAVEPEIQARERERARRKPPESLDAWELLQRGLFHFYHVNETDHAKAISLFKQAIALDPEFAAAHAHLAYAIWGSRTAESLASARASAQRAVSLDPNEPMAHFALGRVHVFSGEPEMAIAEMQTAIAINPNDALAHYGLGQAYWYGAGEVERALTHFDTALRLSPRSPLRWLSLMLKGSALSMLGRHDEAITVCREACQFPESGFLPQMHLAEALAEAGQMEEARAAVERAVEIQPDFSIAYLRGQFVNMHDRTLKSLLDSLRKAGVPE